MVWSWWAALGSVIGSFLNVCIYRMPRERSVVFPPSHCPQCAQPIAWHDNIPILSYLVLRGRCRRCRERITPRYLLVELLTAASTVAVTARFGHGAVGLVYLALVCGLIVASFIDLEFQIIPDEISKGGMALGVLFSVLIPSLHGTGSHLIALQRSVIGLLVGGGLLYVTGLAGNVVFRKESMGGGDVKLLAMAGSILGWKLVVLTFFVAPFLALIPGLAVLLFKRSHVIPYGPFLSLGLAGALFYGNDFLRVSGIGESVKFLWEFYWQAPR